MMMADMNAETIQQRIQIARRDAEALKDRIKRKKDELADTTRKSLRPSSCRNCAASSCPPQDREVALLISLVRLQCAKSLGASWRLCLASA
jgi:hypothetical protein